MGDDPELRAQAGELARTVGGLIAHELTPRQREVLIAMAINETSASALAAQLHSTPGALYKTLHDARRKLRNGLQPDRPRLRRARSELTRGPGR